MLLVQIIGALSLVAWVYLLFARDGFWRMHESLVPTASSAAKSVAVVIPARNEEQVIARAITSLHTQNYPGPFQVFLVNDHSTDATVAAAGVHPRLQVVQADPLPQGWTGKLWAISAGLNAAARANPDYILLTDADIVHTPGSVAGLVARAERDRLDLASYMVSLRCESVAERALIPAFVYFFFQLYPPARIARRDRAAAGAAGGCILIRPSALARIGGIQAICGELIDDCALASAVKRTGGAIWLGLTRDARSIREYSSLGAIRRMIARTAFTQLRYSAILLAGTILGLTIIYVAPPMLLLTRNAIAIVCGALAWLLMTISYVPILRFYRRSILWSPALPLVAIFYMVATIDSAVRCWTGRGGSWKGRVQAAR